MLHSTPRGDPPDAASKRASVAVRAHVRQCDPFLFFDLHDDSPQEVSASLQNILYNALSAVVFLFHLVATFSHFHAQHSALCMPSPPLSAGNPSFVRVLSPRLQSRAIASELQPLVPVLRMPLRVDVLVDRRCASHLDGGPRVVLRCPLQSNSLAWD